MRLLTIATDGIYPSLVQQGQLSNYPNNDTMIVAGDLRFFIECLEKAKNNSSNMPIIPNIQGKEAYKAWLQEELNKLNS